jgi:hypothetical protein
MKKVHLSNGESDSQQIRLLYPGSRFLDKVYDPSIIGFDSMTGSVIYESDSLNDLVKEHFKPENNPVLFQDWYEWFDSCLEIVNSMFQENNTDGKVPPSLMSLYPGLGLSFEFNVDKTNLVSVFGPEKQLKMVS